MSESEKKPKLLHSMVWDRVSAHYQDVVGEEVWRDHMSMNRLSEVVATATAELILNGVAEISVPYVKKTDGGPKHLRTRLGISVKQTR